MAGILCILPPLIGVPVVLWLTLNTLNVWVLVAAPPLFGLGFLSLGRLRAHLLTVICAAALPCVIWVVLMWWIEQVCAGSRKEDYCGLFWGLFVLYPGIILALLAIMIVAAKTAGDAARTDRERWRAARDAAFGPPRS
jgi:hypothetical protein